MGYRNDAVFIIQGWGDITLALELAGKRFNTTGVRPRCVLVDLRGAEPIMSNSGLFSQVLHLHRFGLKNALGMIRQFRETMRVASDLGNEVEKITFFSEWVDLATFHLVIQYIGCCEIVLNPNYLMSGESSDKISDRLIQWVVRTVFGVNICICKTTLPSFHYRWCIPEEITVEANATNAGAVSRLIEPAIDSRVFNILVVDGIENTTDPYWMGVASEFDKILRIIRKQEGLTLQLKCHPRIGYRNMCEGLFDQILPVEIPIELLDLSQFDMVLTVHSTSLARINHDKKVFLFQAMSAIPSERKIELTEYIQRMENRSGCSTKGVFVTSQSEFIQNLSEGVRSKIRV